MPRDMGGSLHQHPALGGEGVALSQPSGCKPAHRVSCPRVLCVRGTAGLSTTITHVGRSTDGGVGDGTHAPVTWAPLCPLVTHVLQMQFLKFKLRINLQLLSWHIKDLKEF